MAKEQWSPETQRLREEAGTALDKLNRSMEADRASWGRYEDMDDDERDARDLTGKHLTAWAVVSQYQGMTGPESSYCVYATSGCTNATAKGLSAYGLEAF